MQLDTDAQVLQDFYRSERHEVLVAPAVLAALGLPGDAVVHETLKSAIAGHWGPWSYRIARGRTPASGVADSWTTVQVAPMIVLHLATALDRHNRPARTLIDVAPAEGLRPPA